MLFGMAHNVPEKNIVLGDREFSLYIPYEAIKESVAALAETISRDYAGRPDPLFLGVLNGSFMFMAELVKAMDMPVEVSFVKLASYSGLQSSGSVSELIGLSVDVKGRHVVIVEDIVDTGESIEHLVSSLAVHRPASIEVATLLFKPESYGKTIPIRYKAFSIPNDFVIGFGMDYDQMGRYLRDIYTIVDGE